MAKLLSKFIFICRNNTDRQNDTRINQSFEKREPKILKGEIQQAVKDLEETINQLE